MSTKMVTKSKISYKERREVLNLPFMEERWMRRYLTLNSHEVIIMLTWTSSLKSKGNLQPKDKTGYLAREVSGNM